MFNCHCVFLAGRPIAYFKTQLEAETYVRIYNLWTFDIEIKPQFIPGIF